MIAKFSVKVIIISNCMLKSTMDNVSNDFHCYEFSKSVAEDIFIIKVFFGSLGVLLSLVVLILIGVTKLYKQFVYRLVMYLMIVNTLQAVCIVLEILPIEVTGSPSGRIEIKNGTGWPEACSFLGYFDIVTSWYGNFVVIWTMLYMLTISWKIYKYEKDMLQERFLRKAEVYQQRKNSMTSNVREIVGVIGVLIGPLFFSWIPFIQNMYGPSGPWCWIKTIPRSGCGDERFQDWSISLMMIMFYGPLVEILVFGLLCMLAIIILLWKSSKHLHGWNRQKYQSSIKEIVIVLVYPVVYCIFCIFLLMNRIYSDTHTKPLYPLWIIHAIADPVRIVIPAVAFLLHPHVWKKVYRTIYPNESSRSEGSGFYIPPEDEDVGEGIVIKPSQQNDYRSIQLFTISGRK